MTSTKEPKGTVQIVLPRATIRELKRLARLEKIALSVLCGNLLVLAALDRLAVVLEARRGNPDA